MLSLHQQLITWEQRFDALAALAADRGVDHGEIDEIRWRPFQGDMPDSFAASAERAAATAHAAAMGADAAHAAAVNAHYGVTAGLPLPPSSKSPPGANKRVGRASCGECAGCRMADCNACKYCLDKPKLGGSGTLRRKCVLRVCENESNVAGNGLPLPDQAATVACEGAAAAAAAMAAVQQASGGAGSSGNAAKRVKKTRCGECAGCLTRVDCNECKYCLDKPKLGGNNTLRRMCARRVCNNATAQYEQFGGAQSIAAHYGYPPAAHSEVATPQMDDPGSVLLALPLAASAYAGQEYGHQAYANAYANYNGYNDGEEEEEYPDDGVSGGIIAAAEVAPCADYGAADQMGYGAL